MGSYEERSCCQAPPVGRRLLLGVCEWGNVSLAVMHGVMAMEYLWTRRCFLVRHLWKRGFVTVRREDLSKEESIENLLCVVVATEEIYRGKDLSPVRTNWWGMLLWRWEVPSEALSVERLYTGEAGDTHHTLKTNVTSEFIKYNSSGGDEQDHELTVSTSWLLFSQSSCLLIHPLWRPWGPGTHGR